MTEHLHHITHTHDTGHGIDTKFTCTGDRTSPCHQYPPSELEREPWSGEDKHLFVPHDVCWLEQWMNGADCAILCGPDGEPVRSGPINATWGGDCVEWEYAEPAATPDDVHQARADADRARSDAAWDLYRGRPEPGGLIRGPRMNPCGGHQHKERTMTEKTIDKSKTVTIDRDKYNILLAAYKAFEAAERAAWARSTVPMLSPNEINSLDQA